MYIKLLTETGDVTVIGWLSYMKINLYTTVWKVILIFPCHGYYYTKETKHDFLIKWIIFSQSEL